MRYNLRSSMADRINFDEMLKRMAAATLNAVPDEIKNIKNIADEYVNDMWEMESEFLDVDDIEEAKARFFSVYRDEIESSG